MPLEIGNKWTYLLTSAGAVTATSIYEVVAHKRIGAYTFAAIAIETTSLARGITERDTIYTYNAQGALFFDSPQPDRKLISYFRYPISPGDQYSDPNQKRICGSSGKGVEVPAGIFDVVIYGPCAEFDSDRTMFAPDLGLVFSGDYARSARILSSYELVK